MPITTQGAPSADDGHLLPVTPEQTQYPATSWDEPVAPIEAHTAVQYAVVRDLRIACAL